MPDKTLTCRDCGTSFIFSEREQEFFAQKGFTNEPSRCPDCRAARKAARGSDTSYGGGSFPMGGAPRPPEMFPALFSPPGTATQAPFLPPPRKPLHSPDPSQPPPPT